MRRHRPRLITVRQFELKHGLKQRRIGRVFHHALTFQSSGALRCCKFLGLSAGCRPICTPLETVCDANYLPRLLVDLREVHHVLLHIPLQGVNPNHGHVCRAVRPQRFHVFGVVVNVRRRRQRHKGARFQQFVQDLGLQPVGAVLLVCDLVNVAVTQEFPVDADVFLQNDWVNVRLIVRHPHGLLYRHRNGQPHGIHHGFVQGHPLHHASDGRAIGSHHRIWQFLAVLFRALPLCPAAVRACLTPPPRQISCHARRCPVQCGRVQTLQILCRFHGAACGALFQPPRLIVLQIDEHIVCHP